MIINFGVLRLLRLFFKILPSGLSYHRQTTIIILNLYLLKLIVILQNLIIVFLNLWIFCIGFCLSIGSLIDWLLIIVHQFLEHFGAILRSLRHFFELCNFWVQLFRAIKLYPLVNFDHHFFFFFFDLILEPFGHDSRYSLMGLINLKSLPALIFFFDLLSLGDSFKLILPQADLSCTHAQVLIDVKIKKVIIILFARI